MIIKEKIKSLDVTTFLEVYSFSDVSSEKKDSRNFTSVSSRDS